MIIKKYVANKVILNYFNHRTIQGVNFDRDG